MKTNINSFIKNEIENYSRYSTLSSDEKKQITYEGVATFILKKINSNKYKGSKYPAELVDKITKIVDTAVATSKPIHFSIPFGGFKKSQYSNYPHIDWAEIFNIIQLRNFAVEIAKGYEPGVIIQYVSDEIFIERMNNMSQRDLDTYNNEFNLAVAYIQQFTPSNVILRYTKIRDEISQKEISRRFDQGIEEMRGKWNELSPEEQNKRIEKSKRNLILDTEVLTEEQVKQKCIESTFVHDAFIFTDWEQGVPWAFRADMIPIGFRYTGTWGIHLKSSVSSTVQFWVGHGLVEKKGNSFLPKIVTYNQYKEIENKLVSKPIPCKTLPSCFGLKEISVIEN